MSSASARKGSNYERDLVDYLRTNGLTVERLRPTGVEDEGDLAITFPQYVEVVEAKAENRLDLPGYLREAEREKSYYAQHRQMDSLNVRGVVIIKRRMAPIGKSYVIHTVDDYYGIGF